MVSSPNTLERRSETALRLLRERLRRPDAREGTRLPPERALAAELKMSRRAIREALASLEAEGLIWRTPGRGTVIARRSSAKPVHRDDLRQLTSPRELMDARMALEPAIAALAAVHATSHDMDEMLKCLTRSGAVTDHTAWERWDGALHRAIGTASHNSLIERLLDLLNAARSHVEWGRMRQTTLTPERQQLYTRQHRGIIAAIENRDPEQAARLMRQHLITVRHTLLEQMRDPLGSDFLDGHPDNP
ncbi:MAG: FCD domain-containing protein [Aquisalimonadaceae bacterium]